MTDSSLSGNDSGLSMSISSGSVGNGGTRARDGRISLPHSKVKCWDRLHFVCTCFLSKRPTLILLCLTTGDHRGGKWECFQISRIRVAGKKELVADF